MMKHIKGLEGFYTITEDGRIYSVRRSKYLKPLSNRDGYLFVIMNVGGKQYRERIHRLVAMHFIENKDNLPEVNHKNGNKKDNHFTNLEWSTRSKNVKHSYDTGLKPKLRGEKHGKSKIVINTAYGIFYDSVVEAASTTRFKYDTLKSMLNGANKNTTEYSYA